MEVACLRTVEHLRFQEPRISHAAVVLVLGLAFYSEDPDDVGDDINIFLFLDMSPLASSEAALLARRWDDILVRGALTSFADTSLLLVKQWVEPVTSWEAAEKQLEAWGVFYHVFLGDVSIHPATYDIYTLVEETAYAGARL